jgi:hypothetical protein
MNIQMAQLLLTFRLALLICFSISATAHARIGESIQQIESRYGSGERVPHLMVFGAPAEDEKVYLSNGMHIMVLFVGGKSVAKIFITSDKTPLSDADVSTFLNAKEAGSWEKTKSSPGSKLVTWTVSNKTTIAVIGNNLVVIGVPKYLSNASDTGGQSALQ